MTKAKISDESHVRLAKLFDGHEAELGTPDQPTQAGFKAMALAGQDVWNSWRKEWPSPAVDFGGWDFQVDGANFSGYTFGDQANFAKAQFGDGANFEGAQFGIDARFNGAVFSAGANFIGAEFLHRANFEGAQFGSIANFRDVQFGHSTTFKRTQFNGKAIFRRARFGNDTRFENAQFSDEANFDGAQFGKIVYFDKALFRDDANFTCVLFDINVRFVDVIFSERAVFDNAQLSAQTNFSGAIFRRMAWFYGAQFSGFASFERATFEGRAMFDGRELGATQEKWKTSSRDDEAFQARLARAAHSDAPGKSFQSITFAGAHFVRDVNFHNRRFDAMTNFGPAITRVDDLVTAVKVTEFDGIPKFHGCKLHQDTSFDRAIFSAPMTSASARAYRTLKLAMAQHQAVRDEQLFFRLEMAAESNSIKGMQRTFYFLYKVLSNYGFSLKRPLFFWAVCLGAIGLVHGALSGPSALESGVDWGRTSQWAQYVLFNSLPLPGFDKYQLSLREELFDRQDQTRLLFVILFDLLHKGCALVALFLVGLALRNLFKMRG